MAVNSNTDLVLALRACAAAMRKSIDAGCTDHLDACDDAGKFWHEALSQADLLVINAVNEPSELTVALDHLGNALQLLANLALDERCVALDVAQEFYNARCPQARVMAVPGYVSKLVTFGPIDFALLEQRDND